MRYFNSLNERELLTLCFLAVATAALLIWEIVGLFNQ